MLMVLLALLGAVGTYDALLVLGHLRNDLAWLMRWETQLPGALVGGLGVAWLAHRKLPPAPWKLATMGVAFAIVAGVLFLLVGPWLLHSRYGTPVVRCGRPGMAVEECIGRDWSFLQDRLGYERMRSTVEPEECRRFIAGVPEEPESPTDDARRVRCPYDDPSVWNRVGCDAVGLPDRAMCVECSSRAATNDAYIHAQGFSTDCSEVTTTYGVNVPPKLIDACHRSASRSRCFDVVYAHDTR
ncbi:MAG: hypothetical protein AAF447_06675 [Myxococcota bacterium]